ncbi:MAG: beta-lactamase family protein [Verrucomicrobiaceae bacterium]|nr:beta-lactamase family protein [Verrucomicrobiaceae bacterium]
MIFSRTGFLFLLGVAFPLVARADVPKADAQGLASVLQSFIEDQLAAGLVTVVANGSKVLDVTCVGHEDVDAKRPMKPDSMFWIASMSKAITAAGVMALVDDGKLKLDDPVAKYLPEFKDQRVVAEVSPQKTILVPPLHPITLQDCLCHTAGLPFKSIIEQPTLDLLPLRLAAISHAAAPLMHQPDSKYQYSNAGINIAGRIIEIVSGQDYESFLKQRIFAPLGMNDTTSFPSEEQVSRLAAVYRPNNEKTALEMTQIGQLKYPLTSKDRQPMPGGGFFSTAGDVTKFCQMLLNGGTLGGKRVLSEASARAMHERQTPTELSEAYGLGLKLEADGRYGHGGAQGTNMTVDPARGLVMIYMIQTAGQRTPRAKEILPTFHRAAAAQYSKH